MTLQQIADELYGLPPEEFTSARTAAAKADKLNAKEINALRKPTVGAWLVNILARREPDLLEQLLSLGPALADAQRSGEGAALRELGQQRRQLIGAVTARAFDAADRAPTAAARSEVESTLEAALADPSTADAVRSGRLVRPLSYAGFGGVDLDGAVAVGSARPAGKKSANRTAKPSTSPAKAMEKADRSKDIAAAESRAQDAAGDLDDAVRVCEQAQQDQTVAEEAEQQAAQRVSELETSLHAAREARAAAEQSARKARHRTDTAAKAVAEAQKSAEKARAALDRLRRT